ncbi:MAG: tripartite tricarboxylate transporter substrate binding protein [Betaproteobacteria bacterium]|nr:tripartite tricarboxylate transporter substrate binding protein [Betaproteobacteria bacterium]
MPNVILPCIRAAIPFMILAVVIGAPGLAAAQSAKEATGYPVRPIRIVVPFPPGGVADIAPRVVGPKLVEAWKRPVVVDNRPGAGGTMATEIVAKAAPDGYMLLSASANHTATPAVRAKLPFDTIKDFAGITLTSSGAYALVVAPSFSAKSVKELVALARAKPGQLNFASAGVGSGTHFAGELFKSQADINLVHVAYKGTPEALTDVIAGRVQFYMVPLFAVTGLIKDGKVLALGVSTKSRVPLFPDIPTIAESGVPAYEWNAWTALLAPAKTPRPIINQLHREVVRVLALPDVHQRMAAIGAEVTPIAPAQLDKMIASEIAMTTQLARKAGIKAE